MRKAFVLKRQGQGPRHIYLIIELIAQEKNLTFDENLMMTTWKHIVRKMIPQM